MGVTSAMSLDATGCSKKDPGIQETGCPGLGVLRPVIPTLPYGQFGKWSVTTLVFPTTNNNEQEKHLVI